MSARNADRLARAQLSTQERDYADKVLALVQDLPDEGSVVFVYSRPVLALLRDVVLAKRGPDLVRATRFIVAPTEADERLVCAGLMVPVFRDPFVIAHRAYLRALGGAWRL